jgi:hypothetical protein
VLAVSAARVLYQQFGSCQVQNGALCKIPVNVGVALVGVSGGMHIDIFFPQFWYVLHHFHTIDKELE